MAAAAIAATTGVLATGVTTPTYALASCPSGHVCFYHDFNDNNGHPLPAGTMSDQTASFLGRPTQVEAEWFLGGAGAVEGSRTLSVSGFISDFHNRHYPNTPAGTLNDSISYVVNNSDNCLVMYGNGQLDIAENHLNEGVAFGPHTQKAMVGANLGDDNDKFSSGAAFRVDISNPGCAAAGHYRWILFPNIGG
jgi:hypothetical protein